MHACVLVHVKARGWYGYLPLSFFTLFFLRLDISLNMELAIWTRLAGQKAVGSNSLHATSAQLQAHVSMLWLLYP